MLLEGIIADINSNEHSLEEQDGLPSAARVALGREPEEALEKEIATGCYVQGGFPVAATSAIGT